MRFFLIGFMGCGKSSIGKELASSIKYSFIDLDQVIEKNEGCYIHDIFKEKGEEEFRKIEHHYLENVILCNNAVIATGGGTPCFFNNMEIIKQNGVSIYLKYNSEVLASRLFQNKSQRPLLKKFRQMSDLKKYIDELLIIREGYYLQSDIVLNDNDISANTIKKELSNYLV